MSPLAATGISVVGVSALSLVGLFALVLDEKRVLRIVPLLATLGAAAMAGAAVFDLIPEALARGATRAAVVEGVIAGFLAFAALELLLRSVARARRPTIALNFTGDALHNAVDGALIAAGFLANTTVGVITTFAIVLHEIPRELGSFGIFLHGGLSVRRAVWYNALTGVTELASALLTLAIGSRVADVATMLLPFAAGTFFYIALSVIASKSWRPLR